MNLPHRRAGRRPGPTPQKRRPRAEQHPRRPQRRRAGPAGSSTPPRWTTSPTAAKLRDADDIDEEALLAEFEAEKPARKLSGHPGLHRPGRRRRAVAVRPLLGVQPDAAPGLPADVPERRPVPDLPDLPRLAAVGEGQGSRRARPPQRPGLGAGPAVAGPGGLHRLGLAGLLPAGDRARPTWTSSSARCWCCCAWRRPAARSASWCRWSWSASSAMAYFGSVLPGPFTTADFDVDAPDRAQRDGHAGHLRRPARRGGDLHHPVHDLRRGPGRLGRHQVLHRPVLRRVRAVAGRAGPHGHALRVPARHGVRLGRRDHGHPRWVRLAAAEEGRLSGGGRRRRAGRRRYRRDPVAADPGCGRVHHRRAARASPTSRCSSGRRSRRSCTTSGSSWRSRWTPAGTARTRSTSRRSRLAAAAPLRLPLQLAGRDRRLHGARLHAVPCRRLRHRAGLRAELPGPHALDHPEARLAGAEPGRDRRPLGHPRDGRRPGSSSAS